jgi:hypothetical protein
MERKPAKDFAQASLEEVSKLLEAYTASILNSGS